MSQTEVLAPIVLGNPVRATVKFRNKAGELKDPTTVTLILLDPRGARTRPTATRVSEGEWFYEWTPGRPGPWKGRFIGTGALEAAQKFVVDVENSEP